MDDNNIKIQLKAFLANVFGSDFSDPIQLPQAGSDRKYFRFSSSGRTFIATFVPDRAEGECFVKLARDFHSAGRYVPEILSVSGDFHYYIQEDLGDKSLFSALGFPDTAIKIKDTLSRLVSLQKTPKEIWYDDCMSKDFCARQVLWDLNYFKYEFLKPHDVIFDEDLLEDDFDRLSKRLVDIPQKFFGFMMRDCQSRNVMLTEKGPVFIDFQGGRWGPVLYDVVSFLWQARAKFSDEFKREMLDYYSSRFCEGDDLMKEEMLSYLNDIVLFRSLQVLGAYGFRGLVQHRAHFLLSIPQALANLRSIMEIGWIDSYPEIKRCADILTKGILRSKTEKEKCLTVEIFSFSYKKGYPVDFSGNGGGFMFDCRSMHNPGRYTEYRSLTGRDKPVIDFLEKRGEVQAFLKNAWAMIDPAIERYLSRGFSNLQVGFGCTGGQHRSVYCAEHTAAHIQELFPEANVKLTHREHPNT